MTGAGFEAELLAHRAAKDAHFRAGRGPLEPAALADFGGLAYYPPDPAYRLTAQLAPGPGEEVLIQTTTGEVRPMQRLGTVEAALPVGPVRLALYAADPSSGRAFLPFRDATSGAETYGAGRYLDVAVGPGGHVELDFNRAYHPSCAYSGRYSCPLPPAENMLTVPVRAGERLPG